MRVLFALLGVCIILAGISFGGVVAHFINLPSMLIVFGITLFFTFAHHSVRPTVLALAAALKEGTASSIEIKQHIRVLSTARVLASASGVIGTLIGLVNMLANLDDPTHIGPAMAVGLLTLLYGVILAELFIGPLINRLRGKLHDDDASEKPITVTAVTFAAIPVALIAFSLLMQIF